MGVAAVFVAALALFGTGSETPGDATTSTFADIDIPDPPLTTTTRPRVVDAAPDVVVIEDPGEPFLLGLERLVVVLGQSPTGHRLVVIDHGIGETSEIELPARAAEFRLDASGSVLAYAGDLGLELVTVDGMPIEVPADVNQFVWSGDEPLTALWTRQGDGGLVVGRVEGTALVATDVLDEHGEVDSIVGATSSGWWSTRIAPTAPRTTLVSFHPRGDSEGWESAADVVVTPRTGTRALLARLDVSSWSWTFGLGAGDLRPLSWAPGDASGDHGFAALSPTGVQAAFIGGDDRGLGWLEVHSTVGGTARRLSLPYRLSDVRWSQRGDYVVMPGTDDRGTHFVVLSDTRVTSTQLPWVYAIEMDDRVQFAMVVDTPRHTTSDTGPAGN